MKQYIVDAFTSEVFHGNQAAVCVMESWPSDDLMMSITKENNFSETAFTVREGDGYRLRWFTPGGEIDLCGHATLGTAYVLFRFYEKDADALTFHTLSGDLFVTREGERIVMDFPSYKCHPVEVSPLMGEVMGTMPREAYLDRDLLLVYDDERVVRAMRPDFQKMLELDGLGVGVTSPGVPDSPYDCVSRFFAPKLKVKEDPVTGSVHCMIAPYWAGRLGKNELSAYQASERGGELTCRYAGERTYIAGEVALFSAAELYI